MQRSSGVAEPSPIFDAPTSKVLRDEVFIAIERAELDLAFHDEIYRLSGHQLLQEAWSNLRAKIRVLLVATGALSDPTNWRKEAYRRGHAPILEALRAREADRAEAAVVRHLADGERLLLEKLGATGVEPHVSVEAFARCPELAGGE